MTNCQLPTYFCGHPLRTAPVYTNIMQLNYVLQKYIAIKIDC